MLLSSSPTVTAERNKVNDTGARLSKVISQHSTNLSISRRQAERLILEGEVTIAGKPITSPHFLVDLDDSHSAIKVAGKHVHVAKEALVGNSNSTRIWLVHKLPGEVVSEFDPQGRPSMLERLKRGGVGKRQGRSNSNNKRPQQEHLKAVGRLDLSTEGLILVTNDGQHKRKLELPSSQLHRVYRVRVHGKLAPYKLKTIRKGMTIENTRYGGMKVEMETSKTDATNNWLRITCIEGKNRQIRKVFSHLGLNVTRLIRIAFGDYELQTIPPGMALEVPLKAFHRRSGPLGTGESKKRPARISSREDKGRQDDTATAEKAPQVQWVRNL